MTTASKETPMAQTTTKPAPAPPQPAPARKTQTGTRKPPAVTKPAKAKVPAKRPAMKRGTGKASLGTPAGAGEVLLADIDPTRWPNPRGEVDQTNDKFRELVDSIRENGVLQNLVLGPAALADDHKLPLVAGWRRYYAAQAAGLKAVPARQVGAGDAKAVLIAGLAENMAREQMSPLAEARSIGTLVTDYGLTQTEAGKAVGMSERTVRERLRLLALPKDLQNAVDQGRVPMDAMVVLQRLAPHRPDMADRLVEWIEIGEVRARDLQTPELWEIIDSLEFDLGSLNQIPSSAQELIRGDPLIAPGLRPAVPTVSTEPLIAAAKKAGKLLTLSASDVVCDYVPDRDWLGHELRCLFAAAEDAAPLEQTPTAAPATNEQTRSPEPPEPAPAARPNTPKSAPSRSRAELPPREDEIRAWASAANAQLHDALADLEPIGGLTVDQAQDLLWATLSMGFTWQTITTHITSLAADFHEVDTDERARRRDAIVAELGTGPGRARVVMRAFLGGQLRDFRSTWSHRHDGVFGTTDRGLVDRLIVLSGVKVPDFAAQLLAARRRFGDELAALRTAHPQSSDQELAVRLDDRPLDVYPPGMPPTAGGAQ